MSDATPTTPTQPSNRRAVPWRRAAGVAAGVLAVAGIGALVHDVAASSPRSAVVVASDGRPVAINAHQGSDGDRTFSAPVGGLCSIGTHRSGAGYSSTDDGARLDVEQTFTCADGSGTFTIGYTAFVHGCDAFHHGTWQFVGGTGAYRAVRGSGDLVGLYSPGDACLGLDVDEHFRGVMTGVGA
jgi:hypothetical protein